MTALTALKKPVLAPSLCKVFLKWYRKYTVLYIYLIGFIQILANMEELPLLNTFAISIA